MRSGKCMGDPMGVIGDRLYEVWEVYGDPYGVIGGRLYKVWEVYGDPMGVIGGRLYEVWEVYVDSGWLFLYVYLCILHKNLGPTFKNVDLTFQRI